MSPKGRMELMEEERREQIAAADERSAAAEERIAFAKEHK